MKTLYTAVATATSGRDGRVRAEEPALDLALAMPKSIGGPGGAGTNPEQLFAAGYAACFGSALKLVASKKGTPVKDAIITAHVSLGLTETQAFKLAVELHAQLPGVPRADAEALVAAAHQVCPYSNATRGNIDVTLVVD